MTISIVLTTNDKSFIIFLKFRQPKRTSKMKTLTPRQTCGQPEGLGNNKTQEFPLPFTRD